MAGHAQLRICRDGMLEDTNSLDAPMFYCLNIVLFTVYIIVAVMCCYSHITASFDEIL